jgi:L-alanine-DL-glutamate epimerase-like enolase superfamily enzyme
MPPTIDAVEVVTTKAGSGGENCFIKLQESGETGWYGPVNNDVGRYVSSVLADVVTHESSTEHERLYRALRRTTTTDTTAVASWAVGAVDCAAWDLHGQLAQASVAELLTVSPLHAVPLYASWLSLDVTRSSGLAPVAQIGRSGWQFTKWGLRRDAANARRVEASRLAATVQAVARAVGGTAAFDAVFTWDEDLADLVVDCFDPADLLWLEDPLPDYGVDAYASLASRTPLAIGERLLMNESGQTLLNLQPRALTIDVLACGGITRSVELVRAAHALGVPVHPHGRSFVPALHLAAAFPGAIPAVEYRLQWEPVRQQAYAQSWIPEQGAITVPRSPGLGAAPRSP